MGAETDFESVGPCFRKDAQYFPINMPGQGKTSTPSAALCQRRCRRVPGCARFTWTKDRSCHLQEIRSKVHPADPGSGVVSGPADCNDDDEFSGIVEGKKAKANPPTTQPPLAPATTTTPRPPRTTSPLQAPQESKPVSPDDLWDSKDSHQRRHAKVFGEAEPW